jgi:hypothetical protein
MLLLISDANILIDMEAGELMTVLFRLPMQFGIPDILYWEEIEPGTPGLEHQGLRVLEVSGAFVAYATSLPAKYGTAPSPNDYLALALAKQEGCPLLTGDQDLKQAARGEDVSVMGSVWLLRVMVENQLLTVDQALAALALMRERKRRLPWAEAERVLNGLREA